MKWIVILASIGLMAGLSPAAAQEGIDAFRWKNRVLVLFAPDPRDETLALQTRRLLADRDALAERELVVLAVTGDRVETLHGGTDIQPDARALRRHFALGRPAGFQAFLVGKDGGTKWRSEGAFELADLNAVIDAMPMRRAGR